MTTLTMNSPPPPARAAAPGEKESAPMSNLKGKRLLFIGDSITAENPSDPSHGGATHRYVTAFDTMLRLKHPGLGATVINKGIGGHTVEHLRQRWEADVLDQKPDWLFVLIGINDAAYLFQHNTNAPEQFEQTYDKLLADTLGALPDVHIVLMTPFLIALPESLEPGSPNAKIAEVLPQYVEAVHRLAEKHGADLIDLDAEFRQIMQFEDAKWLADEPVHPGERGKMFIALRLLDHIETSVARD